MGRLDTLDSTSERLVTKEYLLEYGLTGHYKLSMSVHLHNVLSSVIVLLSLQLLCPCNLYAGLGWRLSAINQPCTSLMSCELYVSKYVNPIASLYQAIALIFRL